MRYGGHDLFVTDKCLAISTQAISTHQIKCEVQQCRLQLTVLTALPDVYTHKPFSPQVHISVWLWRVFAW